MAHRFIYNVLLATTVPIWCIYALISKRNNVRYRNRWREKFGRTTSPRHSDKKQIWVHANSVGEVNAAIPLIKRLLTQYPLYDLLLTTQTVTGAEFAHNIFGDRVRHQYCPFDIPQYIKRFFRHENPALALVIEREWWPNLLSFCHRIHIPIVLCNARLSARSAAHYGKVLSFIRPIFEGTVFVGAQSELDAHNIVSIGASPAQVHITGNLKFDISFQDYALPARSLRQSLFEGRKIFIAASTHAHEEEQILDAFAIIRQTIPTTALILVPRHPERSDQVARLCHQKGYNTVRRSSGDISPNCDVYIGDTMGDLLMLYTASDVVFVGGSLVAQGGHNVIEPAACGIPIIVGPHTHNFKWIIDNLLQTGHIVVVQNAEELATHVTLHLQDDALCERIARKNHQWIDQHRGALNKTMDLIDSALSEHHHRDGEQVKVE